MTNPEAQGAGQPPSSSTQLETLGGWPGVLGRLIKGERLSSYEAGVVMTDVLSGGAAPARVGAFLSLLRARGESVDEVVGFAEATLTVAVPIPGIAPELHARLVDTCGTGGDKSGTINVSTMAALVAARAGVPVCKHGNRASSSQTGSADVLEALGAKIDLGPEGIVQSLDHTGMAFCLASLFHSGFRHVGPIRKELGVGTVFNFLGPLINPARVKRQVIGVSDPSVAELMLSVLTAHGATRAMVVYGHDGLDEITTTTLSTVHELKDGKVRQYQIDPTAYGLSFTSPVALKGGSPKENAERVRRILGGEASPQADIVALNAAAAILVGDGAESYSQAFEMAKDLLSGGSVLAFLDEFVAATQRAAQT